MTTGQLAITVIVILFAGYLIMRATQVKGERKKLDQAAALANNLLAETVANTMELKVNSALLRENTALLKELLEKQDQTDP